MNASIRMAVCAGLTMAAAASATRAAPDLSGPWQTTARSDVLKTAEGNAPTLTAAGAALLKTNRANLKEDPARRCLPPGVPRVMLQPGFAFNFVVGQDVAGMFFEWNHLPRPIWINNQHFENIGPTYLGQSVGKWEGDTLVVDTNGFNDTTWLDSSGLPHSDQLETVERIRLRDANTLEDQITFKDPKVFTRTWSTVLTFTRRPGYVVKEDFCLKRLNINAVTGE